MTAHKRPHDRERGQSIIEYTLIIAFIALVVIAALVLLGPPVGSSLSRVIPYLEMAPMPRCEFEQCGLVHSMWSGRHCSI